MKKEDVWVGDYLISGRTFDWCYLHTSNMGDVTKYYDQFYKRTTVGHWGETVTAFVKWNPKEDKK